MVHLILQNVTDVDVVPENLEAESELSSADLVNSWAVVISNLKAAGCEFCGEFHARDCSRYPAAC